MCTLYSLSHRIDELLKLVASMNAALGNLAPMPGIFPDYAAPIVRLDAEGQLRLDQARWGMPSPSFALKGRKTDPGLTNVRNTDSPH